MTSRNAIVPRLALTVLTAALLVSCQSGSANRETSTETTPAFPPTLGPDQIPVIDRFSDRLVVFDQSTNAIVYEENRVQTFQYSLPGRWDSTIITSGSSNGNEFDIVELTENEIRVIRSLDQAAFPIAREGDDTYLQLADITTSGKLGSTTPAVIDGKGDLRELGSLATQVASAVIHDQRLWYTTHRESTDSYDLWSRSLEPNVEAHDEQTGLSNPHLILYGTTVVTEGNFSDHVRNVDCSLSCQIDHQHGRLLSLAVTDAALTLTAFSLGSGASVELEQGPILDFSLDRHGDVTIYRRDGISVINQEDLP